MTDVARTISMPRFFIFAPRLLRYVERPIRHKFCLR